MLFLFGFVIFAASVEIIIVKILWKDKLRFSAKFFAFKVNCRIIINFSKVRCTYVPKSFLIIKLFSKGALSLAIFYMIFISRFCLFKF